MKVEYDEMMMMMTKKKMKSNDTSICVIFDDEYMMVEILSRLPVKSLLRLKCVSKRWCSLIQDPYFVDLHSARSTTRPGATFLISRDLSGRNITFFGSTLYDGPHFHSIDYVNFISDAGGHDRFGPYYYLPPGGFTGHDKLTSTQILNGLLCMGFNQETVWILNPSTRKTILLTKTNIKEEENTEQTIKNRDGDHDEYNWMNKESFLVPKYAFGFDPVIKKYKVICICHVDIWHIPPQIFLYHPDDGDHDFHPQLLKTYYLCMVLTIDVDEDDNCCWRRIDEIPPYPIHGGDGPVYLNGVLYWGDINSYSSSSSDIDDVNKVIVAFNLSSEKFSVIKIPDLILEHTRSPSRYRYRQQLYEVDGCLAIQGNRNAAAGRPPNTIQIWKLVVLPPPSPPDDDDDVAACCWVKETILTLSFDWRRRGYLFEVIGTNQILLKRNNSRLADASLCYYDRDNNDCAGNKTNKEKNKKTMEKLEFTGECASFTGILPCSGGILQIHRRIHTCTETLWSLNN